MVTLPRKTGHPTTGCPGWLAVAGPHLPIRGSPVIQTPEIRGWGGAVPPKDPDPSPASATGLGSKQDQQDHTELKV